MAQSAQLADIDDRTEIEVYATSGSTNAMRDSLFANFSPAQRLRTAPADLIEGRYVPTCAPEFEMEQQLLEEFEAWDALSGEALALFEANLD